MNKEKIDELVNKVLQAQKLMGEVNKEVMHCSGILDWLIFNEYDFKKICEVLGIEYLRECGKATKNIFLRAHYKGLSIVCIE